MEELCTSSGTRGLLMKAATSIAMVHKKPCRVSLQERQGVIHALVERCAITRALNAPKNRVSGSAECASPSELRLIHASNPHRASQAKAKLDPHCNPLLDGTNTCFSSHEVPLENKRAELEYEPSHSLDKSKLSGSLNGSEMKYRARNMRLTCC